MRPNSTETWAYCLFVRELALRNMEELQSVGAVSSRHVYVEFAIPEESSRIKIGLQAAKAFPDRTSLSDLPCGGIGTAEIGHPERIARATNKLGLRDADFFLKSAGPSSAQSVTKALRYELGLIAYKCRH